MSSPENQHRRWCMYIYLLLCLTSTSSSATNAGFAKRWWPEWKKKHRPLPPSRTAIFFVSQNLWRLKVLLQRQEKARRYNCGCWWCYFALRDHANTGDEEKQQHRERGARVAHNNRRIITVVLLLILRSISHLFAAAAVLLKFSPETNKSRSKSEQNGRPKGSLWGAKVFLRIGRLSDNPRLCKRRGMHHADQSHGAACGSLWSCHDLHLLHKESGSLSFFP
jgi:hypothetical protein